MSKKIFFILTVLVLSITSAKTFGQAANMVRTGEATGQLDITVQGAPQPVHIDYRVSPAYPDNVLLEMRATSGFDLNARIVDAKGTMLQQIEPGTVGGRYANSIDISHLKAGNYFIEMYGGNLTGSYRIPFTKTVNTTK